MKSKFHGYVFQSSKQISSLVSLVSLNTHSSSSSIVKNQLKSYRAVCDLYRKPYHAWRSCTSAYIGEEEETADEKKNDR